MTEKTVLQRNALKNLGNFFKVFWMKTILQKYFGKNISDEEYSIKNVVIFHIKLFRNLLAKIFGSFEIKKNSLHP